MKLIYPSKSFRDKVCFNQAFPKHSAKLSLYRSIFSLSLTFLSCQAFGQAQDSLLPSDKLKKLSLEELMNVEVTSVSKRPEKLTETASAIQVITQKDIQSSGARTLAEALRLAPNLQVAQVNSSQWAISARGFNNVLANKLLVLIDGRTVYTPLYAGVFWDVQNLVLEDVERIEVISGPGGTLWGANAVNGVINIITKHSKDTKGLFAEGAIGTNMPGLASLRYGDNIGDDVTYRVYATGFKMGSTVDTAGKLVKDEWTMGQGGAQVDWNASDKSRVMLQSNVYYGRPNPDSDSTPIVARGDNALVRWNYAGSKKTDFQLQAYYDHTWRDFGNKFTEDLKTYDIDWQNRIQLHSKHTVTYGLGCRLMEHKVTNLELFYFSPGYELLHLYSGFLQYELKVLKERLRITLGSKVEHNNYTAFQYQPNARITWTPTKQQTLWASASRAVRNPARIDRDFFLLLAPNLPYIAANDSFMSENVIAYELGWRVQAFKKLSGSLSAFYNVYDNLRSVEPGPPPFGIPVTFGNGVQGETYGVELAVNSRPVSWLSLRGGYTFLKKELRVKANSKDMNKASAESNDPQNQLLLQANADLPSRIQVGAVVRYVSELTQPKVDSYAGLDVRIGWKPHKKIELSITAQNLLNETHIEYRASTPPRLIERSIYGKIVCRF